MTIRELRLALETLPDDYRVVIGDADTGWYLNITDIEIDPQKRVVIVSGGYGDEERERA